MSHTAASLHIALLGKTGSGKSSTGNTLLGFNGFPVSANAASLTKAIKTQRCLYDNTTLYVYDTPGLKDVESSADQDIQNAFINMERLMELSQNLDALALVMSFPTRFTEEEEEIIRVLKDAFGNDFLKKHCIIIITRGDIFENTFEDENTDFDEWCKNENGKIQKLFEEVDYRIVLFYNEKSEFEKKKAAGVEKFINQVRKIKSTNGHYKMSKFQESKMLRNKSEKSTKKV